MKMISVEDVLQVAENLIQNIRVIKHEEKYGCFFGQRRSNNEEVGYLDSLDKLRIIPCAFEAIKLINEAE